eukprot:TRINITY_DN4483_c0_g2_i2.p1 TRINITY_DN4483_c0_g2~~TRINITY_DN4483_c0_g2_i2.p1  ORF type:complete len:614 (+),score=167.96 TRINITY_DN4483_c0_g2_i2:717-2558(+)
MKTKNNFAKKLFTLMETKQTNLTLSADLNDKNEILELADKVGPSICMLKTHVDIISNYDDSFVQELKSLAEKHNFLIFEDRKFADIGNTVVHQYRDGVYRIAEWADVTNAYVIAGEGTVNALSTVAQVQDEPRGLLVLAQLSSSGSLATGEYTKTAVEIAKKYPEFVFGFICQEKLADDSFIYCTPGVQLKKGGDDLGQQYNTPEYVIQEKGSDVIIVGRGIYASENPQESAEQYRRQGWEAYQNRTTTPPVQPVYNINMTYDENLTNGPFADFDFENINVTVPEERWVDFLGFKVASPIGIPAGPLLDSKWTTFAAKCGFDIITYKTIRSKKHPCHPLPNVCHVDIEDFLELENDQPVYTTPSGDSNDLAKIAITNSFGMPSQSPDVLREDLINAKNALNPGQILIVSVTGSMSGESYDEYIQDFQNTAVLAKECGADIIEANFSCPNVKTGEGSIYNDPETVYNIATALVQALDGTPLILKLGAYSDNENLKQVLIKAAEAGATAVCGINTVRRNVYNVQTNEPALGPDRTASGICGGPIRKIALDFIKNAVGIVNELNLPIQVVGCGGLVSPLHFDEALNLGAVGALTATGFMWDPFLALKYKFLHGLAQ